MGQEITSGFLTRTYNQADKDKKRVFNPTPEQQKVLDDRIIQAQTKQPLWKQYARKVFEQGTDSAMGLLGISNSDSRAHQYGELVNAGLPFAPKIGKIFKSNPLKSNDVMDQGISYAKNLIRDTPIGEPGLSITIGDKNRLFKKYNELSYRSPSGHPIAVARYEKLPDGTYNVTDLAVDKTKGLLTGRALDRVMEKLHEMGINTTNDTVSRDVLKYIDKKLAKESGQSIIRPKRVKPISMIPDQFKLGDTITNPSGDTFTIKDVALLSEWNKPKNKEQLIKQGWKFHQ